VFFAPALGAPGGRDHSDGNAKTAAPKANLSGQPDGRLMIAPPDEPKAITGGLQE